MSEENRIQDNIPAVDYDSYIKTVGVNETDPIEQLKKRAQENLDRIGGIPGAQDILKAFTERDEAGRLMTIVEFRKSFFSLEKNAATHGYSAMISMDPEVHLEQSGGYTTVVLQFANGRNQEMNRMWHLMEDYGKEQAALSPDADEIPVMSITVVPMLLGGQYGMVAHDPIFYHIQPSDAMVSMEYCDQLRIVFEPESVAFLRDDSFVSADVLETVKRELAAEQMAEDAREKVQQEEESFKQAREKEMEEYREQERQKRYGFTTSDMPSETFRDSTGLRE